MKWKDRLLSSSLPLEYEVGKILTKNNFYIDFDYSYKRFDNVSEKEFSIDIKAGGFYPFRTNSNFKLTIDLLLECKYRNPNVSWVFIKDINTDEFFNFSSKGVIKVIDEFSEIFSKRNIFSLPFCETCLKGMEINIQNGEVHDTGIIHGVNQLVYSIPSLVHSHITGTLLDHLEDVHPFIICPILITTAELRILNENFSITELEKAKSLDDISTEVPFLKIYSDVYPSFKEHCRNIFKETLSYQEQKQLEYFNDLRKIRLNEKGEIDISKMYTQPKNLLFSLQNGIGNDLFRETLVCSLKNFPELLKQIKKGIKTIASGFEKIKKPGDKYG